MSEYERRAARGRIGTRRPRTEHCTTCDHTGHVCANHPNQPWAALSTAPNACRCGRGARCPTCKEPPPDTP